MTEFKEMEVLLLVLVAVAVVLFVVEVVRLLRHRHFNWSRWIYAIILCAVMLGLIHLSSSMFSTALPNAGGGGKALMPSCVMKIADITYAIAIAMTLLASISVTVQSFVRRRNKFPRRMVALILLGLAVISLCLRFL